MDRIMKMIKAVFFDIDGTLVPIGHKEMLPETRDALMRLRENGIKVFVCSGRPITFIDNLGDFPFDGYVTANGAVCLLSDGKTLIYHQCIEEDDINRLSHYIKEYPDNSFVIVPLSGNPYVTSINKTMIEVIKMLNLQNVPLDPSDKLTDEPVVQMMGFMSEQEAERTRLFKDVLTDCSHASWCPLFFDIMPDGSDKANGLKQMAAYFDIPREDTMAFGDGANDISVLKYAGIGVAMGNARKNVQEAADYVTTSDVDNGIVNALKHFKLI